MEGDDSLENKAKLRKLKEDLKNAEDTLNDSLYDKSISDQEDALDKLLENSEKTNEAYLRDSEKVFSDCLVKINANSSVIGKQIEETAKSVGYNVSEYISGAWTESTTAVTNYGEQFTLTSSTVIGQIGAITTAWQEAINKANEYAKASLQASTDQQKDYGTGVGTSTEDFNNKALFDWAVGFIRENSIQKKADKNYKKTYGALNEYLYERNNRNVLRLADEMTLARGLNIDPDKDSKWRSSVVKWLKKYGYSNGGIIDMSDIKRTGEDGIALVKHKEAILTVDQTKMFARFVDSLPVFDQLAESLSKPNVSNVNNSSNNPTYNITSQINVDGVATNEIVKDMENVATRQAENVIAKINRTSYSKGIRKK